MFAKSDEVLEWARGNGCPEPSPWANEDDTDYGSVLSESDANSVICSH
jgi:hypothetical protein